MFGTSTFGVAMKLLKWLPIKLVDRFLLLLAKMVLGDTERHGLRRPKLGPLEIKNITGKSPVLDVGAWSLIKSGNIKVRWSGCWDARMSPSFPFACRANASFRFWLGIPFPFVGAEILQFYLFKVFFQPFCPLGLPLPGASGACTWGVVADT